MAEELSAALAAIVSAAGADQIMKPWLLKEGLTDVEDVALLCKNEADVEKRVVDLVQPAVDGLRNRIICIKVWTACRRVTDKETNVSSGLVKEDEEEAPLDKRIVTDLQSKWQARHRFPLASARLLVSTLYARRYREVNSQPPRYTILLPEAIRTQACVDKRKVQALVLEPGKPAYQSAIDNSNFADYYDLYVRVRADFSTIALVSLGNPDFWSLEDCEALVDRLHGWFYQRFGQGATLAPVSFYRAAYLLMVRYFVEEVQTHNHSLSHAAQQVSQYQHFFTSYNGGPASSTSFNSGSDTESQRRNQQALRDKELKELRAQSNAEYMEQPIFKRPKPQDRRDDRRDDRRGGGGGSGKRGGGRENGRRTRW